MRAWCVLGLVVTVAGAARPAGAERREDALPPDVHVGCCYAGCDCRLPRPSPARRALAIGAALVPGVVLRGAGSYVAQEKPVARKLLYSALGGVVVVGGAGALIGLTGASPYTTPAVPLLLAGVGAVMASWASDLWVAAGGARIDTRARSAAPYSLELGQTTMVGPYDTRVFGRLGARVERDRLGAGVTGMLDASGEAALGLLDLRVRLTGAPPTDTEISDGTRSFVRVGGRLQRDADDRVTQQVGELEIGGRLDLRRVDRALRATFVEGSVGVGVLRATYSADVSDLDSLLLTRMAWGVYVPGGELAWFYDHRRDGLAGGIAAFRAAGFVGSTGATADLRVSGPWALRGELQIGNAWLTTLALAYRGGAR